MIHKISKKCENCFSKPQILKCLVLSTTNQFDAEDYKNPKNIRLINNLNSWQLINQLITAALIQNHFWIQCLSPNTKAELPYSKCLIYKIKQQKLIQETGKKLV